MKNTSLGYSLNEINQKIKAGIFTNDLQQNELFYSLAESIITDQRFVFDHLSKLDFKKNVTNEEVFRAVFQAKSFIDEHITDNLSLEKITLQVGISKYHFIRVFKSVFGINHCFRHNLYFLFLLYVNIRKIWQYAKSLA